MNDKYIGLLGVALLAATSAQAQEPASDAPSEPPNRAEETKLETIVVSARRRSEALQDVPLAVSVLDVDELHSRGVRDLADIGQAVPNLTVYAARGTTSTITAYIRGVGQSDPLWGFEPGVAIYVDDVYLARPQAALLQMLDPQRIEVLRGPQGTLYGKNTIGGAIKYVTALADTQFGGQVDITVGAYQQRDAKAVLNLPFGERLRTRLALGSFVHEGYGQNRLTGARVSDQEARAARWTADWLPADGVIVRLAFDSFRDRSGVRGTRRLVPNRFDPFATPPNANNFDVQNGMPNLNNVDSEGISASVDWLLGDAWSIKSVSAWREGKSRGNIDFDTLPFPIADVAGRFEDEQFSQELQLQYAGDDTQVVTGLYFFDGDAGGDVFNNFFGLQFGGSGGVIGTRSTALYVDATHDLGAGWSLNAGLRYTSEKKTATVLNLGFTDATFTQPNGLVAADFSDSKTFSSLSPKLNLAYTLDADRMIYVQASRGFKSGGYNIRANTLFVPESANPFEDETVTAFEIGAKTQWADGAVTLNAAAFRNNYKDIQLSVFTSFDADGDGVAESFFGDFKNAGKGSTQGVELELIARAGKVFSWMAHLGYLHTDYDEYLSAGVNVADSQRFTNAPRWTSGLSLIADIPLSRGALSARLDGFYQSKVYPTTDLSEDIAQSGYSLWNASLTYAFPGERWQLSVAGRNLSDEAYRTSGYNIPAGGILTGFYGPPRTWWATVSHSF
jgi:iron complex outermembrane receptor protein